ncbi:MAG: esterase/lipase family protein [Phycisphaerales bacterium JB038]
MPDLADEYRRLRAPIVLAHGLLGFDRLRLLGVPTVSYFRLIPDYLRRLGNEVVQTRVPATGSIEVRARALDAELTRLLGTRPCHLLGHSMGGLDARYFITHLGGAERVRSLTTLGTPHRGTIIADLFRRSSGGRRLLGLARRFGLSDAPARDLGTEHMARFNDQTPDDPRVRYFSVAGVKPVGQMDLLLRPSARILQRAAGPNDGLVSVTSAAWGEASLVWPCDHVDMVGWPTPMEAVLRRAPDLRSRYADVIVRLAQAERE